MNKKDMAKRGRPPKYTKKEQVLELFEFYKTECKEKNKMLTKIGFLIKLRICRDTYSELRKKKEFSDTIKQCDAEIEEDWVQNLRGANATGTIFYLKNAFKEEYKDRNETDITSGGKQILQWGTTHKSTIHDRGHGSFTKAKGGGM